MRVYVESTIPSYVVARPARDLLQAARQQLAKDWWEFEREKHELFTSQLVLDEIAFGDKEMAARRLETTRSVPLVRATDEVKELAAKIWRRDSCLPQPVAMQHISPSPAFMRWIYS